MKKRAKNQSWRAALGNKLRQARDEKGLTQEDVGSQLKVSREMIRQYEDGRITLERFVSLVQLLEADFWIEGIHISVATLPVRKTGDAPTGSQQGAFAFVTEYTDMRVKVMANSGEFVIQAIKTA